MKTRRQYDEEFKRMAVELSQAKGLTAQELGITPKILTRWCRERVGAQGTLAVGRAQVSQEQQEIVRLKKELKQAELERDILKKAVGLFSRSDRRRTVGNIRIYKGSPK